MVDSAHSERHRGDACPHCRTSKAGGAHAATIVQAVLLCVAVVPLLVWRDTPQVRTMSLVFVSIVLEAMPFVALGALVAGMVEEFVSREKLAALLPERRVRTILLAAGMGIIFPVCECAVVPVVRRLLRKGVPFSAAVAYLLAGPIVNPIVAASTSIAYVLEWRVVILRLACGYAIAVAVGAFMGRLFEGKEILLNPAEFAQPQAAHDHGEERETGLIARLARAFNHGGDDFFLIGRFLVMGAFIAAALQTLIARSAFVNLARVPVVSILAMMALAIVLNLCSEADAFVAASFRQLVPLPGQLAFMVLGPMLDIKLVIMYLGLFRKRVVLVWAMSTIAAVFAVMVVLSLLLGGG